MLSFSEIFDKISLVLNVRRLCVVEKVLRDFRILLTGMWLRVPAIKNVSFAFRFAD